MSNEIIYIYIEFLNIDGNCYARFYFVKYWSRINLSSRDRSSVDSSLGTKINPVMLVMSVLQLEPIRIIQDWKWFRFFGPNYWQYFPEFSYFFGLVKCSLDWQCFASACHSDWQYLTIFRHDCNYLFASKRLLMTQNSFLQIRWRIKITNEMLCFGVSAGFMQFCPRAVRF